jgi:hypothetical protein
MSDFTKCDTCSKDNNGTFSCPLWMSDGRSFGDRVYSSRCEKQYQMQHDKEFKSSFEYRQFLIENAATLMKQNSVNAFRTFQS